MKTEKRLIKELIFAEYNPRKSTEIQEQKLRESLEKFGCVEPIIVNEYQIKDKDGNIIESESRYNIIIGGHFRVRELKKLGVKEVDCVIVNLTLEEEKELNIRLNANTGEWDKELLNINFETKELEDWGLNIDIDFDNESKNKYDNDFVKGCLEQEYLACPFSVLDTEKDGWKIRKEKWNLLGIKSDIGRDSALLGKGMQRLAQTKSKNTSLTGTSIFDPVLCEIMYSWFSKDGNKVLDVFAGGSVRGIVASKLNRDYTGIELREEQVKANIENCNELIKNNNNKPLYIIGDSNKVLDDIENNFYDFCLSCPPYADLEVYSNLEDDISNMPYSQFIEIYKSIILKLYDKLKDNSFVVWVVGEVRNKKGNYYNFIGDTIKAFIDAGFDYYNEIILKTSGATAGLRNKQFKATRKIVKVHQNILVFVKGNGKEATKTLGDVKIKEIE